MATYWRKPAHGTTSSIMSSTAKERAELWFHNRQEGAKAVLSEYQAKEQATRDLTAKLRAERLAREAKTNNPKPVGKPKAK
jgi:RNA-splicing ligase RtcB